MAGTPSPGRLDSPSVVPRSLIAPRAGSHPPGAAGAVRAGPRAGCYPRELVPSTARSSHPFRLVATAIALNGQSISKRGGRGGSGKGTQLPLITARQPALPQKASAAGEAPAAPLPGGRAAPPPFRAPTFQGIPPRRPSAAPRPPGFVCGVALRRSLAPRFPVCSL